jgi:hypothetical protein
VKFHPTRRTLQIACVLALVGLAFMVWPLLDGRPIAAVIAMSVGQALGTLSFVLFLASVVYDLRRRVLTDDPDDTSFKTIPPEPKKPGKPPENAP